MKPITSQNDVDSSTNQRNVRLALAQLANLKDGWLDGEGVTLAKDQLNWLADTFETNFDFVLPLPYVYPTVSGGVYFEWFGNTWSVSLEINLAEHTAEYQAVHLKNETCFEFNFMLDNSADWIQLNRELAQLELGRADTCISEFS